MQLHQLNSQPPKPEIQAVLDVAEIQGVPVWYQDGMFMIRKVEVFGAKLIVVDNYGSGVLATVNIDSVFRWIEDYKKWNKHETY
jgi:hypothetical protein